MSARTRRVFAFIAACASGNAIATYFQPNRDLRYVAGSAFLTAFLIGLGWFITTLHADYEVAQANRRRDAAEAQADRALDLLEQAREKVVNAHARGFSSDEAMSPGATADPAAVLGDLVESGPLSRAAYDLAIEGPS